MLIPRNALSKLSRYCTSSAAENAKIIDGDGPELSKLLWGTFLKLKRVDKKTFRSVHLLKGRRSHEFVYGGQIFAHALKSGCETVDASKMVPHSMHSYFIKAGSVNEPVDYVVEKLRDSKSFSTRRVDAVQNGNLLFTSNMSFQVREQSSMHHQCEVNVPHGPDGLATARDLLQERLAGDPDDMALPAKFFLSYKLAEFPPTFHRIFEARPVNPDIYKLDIRGELHKPEFTMWIKPTIPIGGDYSQHRLLAAYVSDSSMVETSLLPHLAKGFIPGMSFSLDHCIWFHKPDFLMDDWMLWEQISDFSGGTRTATRARLFTKTGELVMSAFQEGLVRERTI